MTGLEGRFDTRAAEQAKMSRIQCLRLTGLVSIERQGQSIFFHVNYERNGIEAFQAPFS